MNNIRRYTASGIVNIVYDVDDRVAFDFATFNNQNNCNCNKTKGV